MSEHSPDSTGAGSNSSSVSVSLVIKACDMCRKKKIRCEPKDHTCVQCLKYKTHCHFTPISTKRAARRPAGHKRVEELERKLKSVEESLKRATEQLQQTPSFEHERPRREPATVPVMTDELGSTSFMNLLYQDLPTDLASGMPWMNSLSPNFDMNMNCPNAPISSDPGLKIMPTWDLSAAGDMFTRRIFKNLPPRHEAITLIKTSLHCFNSAFPLFNEDFFIQRLDDLDTSIRDPGFWACLNSVLTLGHRFGIRNSVQVAEDNEAWGYFRNALGVVNQLTLMPPSITSVQALLSLAIVIQGTPNPAPYSFLNTAAVKMAQQLGLHRRNVDPNMSAAEIEERKRVFWIAYAMDKEGALRNNEPPAQDDDDMDVDLPDYCNFSEIGPHQHNFFRLRIQLALIQSMVYKRLLSAKASRQSVAERVNAVRDLTAALENWKLSVPIEYQQEYNKEASSAMKDISPVLHSVILRLTYFHTLIAVHRFATPVNQWQEMMEAPTDPNVTWPPPPSITCIEEARKSLKLLLITPQGEYACIWVLLHIFVSATTTLLANVRSDPLSYTAQSDLQLIEPLLSLLGLLSLQGKSPKVEGMYESCRTAWEQARRVVWDARGRGAVSNGRNHMITVPYIPDHTMRQPQITSARVSEEKESLEEFIRRIESLAGGDGGPFEFGFY
ncbi:uncharacterized protein L3040_004372 [Drepanopeziza brunnea f. sp. 'multigermtubi']|uniref:Zn(2)-C6 fungal-type domain-containing protein n=1 Tax=Marssonina brunnea f. sp. multigermtubi (strain MB_m1) TaxID=1072389 RepID=K1Y590_MARBU|nr:uncharacterized protein MBM_01021 [Drepanopeziza brunnea f. sp. 'multigermtubi' MB_m1]EKD20339.1 hypothetical protein MBM_01021 [Drepanopeziza brunnea f. sp. 'multigermtubi' MB_m1]KAJ5042983.1 hypothetical protein L3040_004372 [Drepanopeziza brunnea f. sp. 'multigermtubi']